MIFVFFFLIRKKGKKKKKGEEPSSFGLRLQDSYPTSALSACAAPPPPHLADRALPGRDKPGFSRPRKRSSSSTCWGSPSGERFTIMSLSGSCLGQRLRDQLWAPIPLGKPRSRAGAPHPILGTGRLQPGLAAQTVLRQLVGFSRLRLLEPRGVSWPTGMRNQSSCPRPEPRRSWSLHPGPHDLPEHLLCQAGWDGLKPSTGYGRREKTPLFAETSSPSCTQLSPCSPRLHTPDHLGTSKPPCPRGAHADRSSQDHQAGARGTRGFEVPACPQPVAPQGHPEPGGRWPSLGQKCPGLRPPCGSPGSFNAGDAAELPFSGAAPKRDLPKGSPVEFRRPPSPATPCARHSPTSVATSPPRRASQARQQSWPAGHPLRLRDALEVGVVSESSSLMRKS